MVQDFVRTLPGSDLSINQHPLVIGKKNFLFSDTQDGANASMMAYSLIETAKANGVDPYRYISFVLSARPSDKMSDEEIETLMPWDKMLFKNLVQRE